MEISVSCIEPNKKRMKWSVTWKIKLKLLWIVKVAGCFGLLNVLVLLHFRLKYKSDPILKNVQLKIKYNRTIELENTQQYGYDEQE